MKRALLMVVSVGVVLLLGSPPGCAGRNGLANQDSWLTDSPPVARCTALDPSIARLVLEPQEEAAEERLARAPWGHITPEEAERFAGWNNAPSGGEGELYLVRGIALLHTARGAFAVYRLPANDLEVVFSAVSDAPARPESFRQPLGVCPDTPPPRASG